MNEIEQLLLQQGGDITTNGDTLQYYPPRPSIIEITKTDIQGFIDNENAKISQNNLAIEVSHRQITNINADITSKENEIATCNANIIILQTYLNNLNR